MTDYKEDKMVKTREPVREREASWMTIAISEVGTSIMVLDFQRQNQQDFLTV